MWLRMRRGSRCIELWGFGVVIAQIVRIGTMWWTWIVRYILSCAWLLFLLLANECSLPSYLCQLCMYELRAASTAGHANALSI